MTDRHWQPIPGDPSAVQVAAMFDAGGDWLVTAPGDYQTAAVQAMQRDGSHLQNVVILEWPTRRNHSDEHVMVRLIISPDDALGLAQVLAHTARWMKSAGLS